MPDTRDRIVAFALALPGAFEDHPWGETVAKVGRGKVFVFFGQEGSVRLTVKLDESHGHALALEGAERTGYGLGRSGWVTIPLAAASFDVLRDFVEESYRLVAPKRRVSELEARS
jgi:predicted DNA-binding protein (MmcQ/YjbR family)